MPPRIGNNASMTVVSRAAAMRTADDDDDEEDNTLPVAVALPVHEPTAAAAPPLVWPAAPPPLDDGTMIPTTTDVVPLTHHHTVTEQQQQHLRGVTLVIERRSKEIGRENPWNVYYEGRCVTRLCSGASFPVYGVPLGGGVQVELRGRRYSVVVVAAAPPSTQQENNNALRIRLKHKVKISTGFTGLAEEAWVEPCNTGNVHLDEGRVIFQGSEQQRRRRR